MMRSLGHMLETSQKPVGSHVILRASGGANPTAVSATKSPTRRAFPTGSQERRDRAAAGRAGTDALAMGPPVAAVERAAASVVGAAATVPTALRAMPGHPARF